MRSNVKLYIDGYSIPVLSYTEVVQQQTDWNGRPSTAPQGGFYQIIVPDIGRWTYLFDEWALAPNMRKGCTIEEKSFEGDKMFKTLEFQGAFCVGLKNIGYTIDGPIYILLISTPVVIRNGEQVLSKWWRENDATSTNQPIAQVEEEELIKKWKTIFKPNRNELSKGNYGWDEWSKSLERNCTSDKTNYHNAYTRIEVDGEDYAVPILSMRKDQTITLQLDHTTRSRNEYSTVQIEPHPDFDIHPTDIIDAKEVTIRCLNNATNLSQIKITADNNPAGMLEIYHPKPKSIQLRWVFVEIKGGLVNPDKDELGKKITKQKLESYLKKALIPALIDLDIVNEEADILDIHKLRALTAKSKLDQKGNYIKQSLAEFDTTFQKGDRIKFTEADKTTFLRELHHLYKADTIGTTNVANEIILFLTNLKCRIPNNNDAYDYSNGISLTASGVSAMFIKNEKIQSAVEIPHEVLHAIGLPHTFIEKDKKGKTINKGQKHTFTKKSTKNYMDYSSIKKQTHKWQWDQLYNSKYTK
ncbi:type VI secretion system tube protein TssD [Aquimarina aquimarini]|uniref:type VI secretion system tube protein TssD n=1 Tax=Aquimarina aquimarini TaxID=1191734 RepID=UPI001F23048D|nr:type VI secretion system tube protein TssD [Aquimarina aquimarini]